MFPMSFYIFFLQSIHYELAPARTLPNSESSSAQGLEQLWACQAHKLQNYQLLTVAEKRFSHWKKYCPLTNPVRVTILSQLKTIHSALFFLNSWSFILGGELWQNVSSPRKHCLYNPVTKLGQWFFVQLKQQSKDKTSWLRHAQCLITTWIVWLSPLLPFHPEEDPNRVLCAQNKIYFLQDLIMHLTRIYHFSLQTCLKCRNIYFNDKSWEFDIFLLLQTHGT